MRRIGIVIGGGLLLAALGWLTLAPTAVDPVAWTPPPDPGFTGIYAGNDRLTTAERLDLPGSHGPEALALGPDGAIYTATRDGWIWRIADAAAAPVRWREVGGHPLGLAFLPDGTLLIADARHGLLRSGPDGAPLVVADGAAGAPFGFADFVALAPDGTVWLTDATAKFAPKDGNDLAGASKLEILEHAGTGRLVALGPGPEPPRVVRDGLVFPNGVALAPDGSFLLLAVTGDYAVLKLHMSGPDAGRLEPLLTGLPGFPDNIQANGDGTFWVGLYAPRSAIVDLLAGSPALRKIVARLPALLQPKPTRYGAVLCIDGDGRVLSTLQDPTGAMYATTGALSAHGGIYVSSLETGFLLRLPGAGCAPPG